jgi:uncharacterized membrane protein YqaE (UPF0057 family)
MKSFKTIFLWLGTLVLLYLSFYGNFFQVAPSDYFADFQRDSETLVVGRLAAAQNHVKWPEHSHIGFVSIHDFEYNGNYIYQSYQLLNNKDLPSLSIGTVPLTDTNWNLGIARSFPGMLVPFDARLENYVGRSLTVLGVTRVIKVVERDGNYAIIRLIGDAPLIRATSLGPVEIRILGGKIDPGEFHVTPNPTHFGVQGSFFLQLFDITGHKLAALHRINALLTAAMLTGLLFLYARTFSSQFAIIFGGVTLLSPWISAFGRNLYWVPFTWFLPAVVALLFLRAELWRSRVVYGFLVYLAFMVKCLAGYEYISSVILFAAAPFLYFSIVAVSKENRIRNVRDFFVICFIGVAAFLTALLLHAHLRGPDIWEALRVIYEGDVKRRTYGDPNNFDPVYAASLSSSPLQVLKIYIVNWHTELIKFVPGEAFKFLGVGAIVSLLYRFFYLNNRKLADLALLIAFFLPPVSWFVLAKAHSFIHTQLNFVLWYLGFVPAIFHVCFNGLKLLFVRLCEWAITTEVEEI